jgi:hypothetical protein
VETNPLGGIHALMLGYVANSEALD